MNKRNIMNLILLGGIGAPATGMLGAYALFFVPVKCAPLAAGARAGPDAAFWGCVGTDPTIAGGVRRRGRPRGGGRPPERRRALPSPRACCDPRQRLRAVGGFCASPISPPARPLSPPSSPSRAQGGRLRRRPGRQGRAGQRRQGQLLARHPPEGRSQPGAGPQGARAPPIGPRRPSDSAIGSHGQHLRGPRERSWPGGGAEGGACACDAPALADDLAPASILFPPGADPHHHRATPPTWSSTRRARSRTTASAPCAPTWAASCRGTR